MPPDESRTRTPQQDNDQGVDDGPRKRLRLTLEDSLPGTGNPDCLRDKQIFQVLGIPDTACLFEAGPTLRYTEYVSC